MSSKSKTQRKNTNPFCSVRKRRKSVNRQPITKDRRRKLAESDKGSWFAQEQQWPDHFNIPSTRTEPQESASASKRKLDASRSAFEHDDGMDSEEEFSESHDSESCEEIYTSEDDDAVGEVFMKPTGNYIVDPKRMQELLDTSAICKVCHSSLNKGLVSYGAFIVQMNPVLHNRQSNLFHFLPSQGKYMK